jgi:protein-tyrosine phosphatase
MDESNYSNILALAQGERESEKVHLLRSFDPYASATEVPDPWGDEIEAYQAVLEMVEQAVTGLLKTLR